MGSLWSLPTRKDHLCHPASNQEAISGHSLNPRHKRLSDPWTRHPILEPTRVRTTDVLNDLSHLPIFKSIRERVTDKFHPKVVTAVRRHLILRFAIHKLGLIVVIESTHRRASPVIRSSPAPTTLHVTRTLSTTIAK